MISFSYSLLVRSILQTWHTHGSLASHTSVPSIINTSVLMSSHAVAAPSSYHEFTGPEALAYDGPGTDAGNKWKVEKKVAAYDEE